MKPLVISFSGGRTSGYMAKLLIDKYKGKRDIYTIFANTGKEREETLDFVNRCDIEFGLNVVWIESVQNHGKRQSASYKIVDFKTASRKGEPFEDMIKKHGIPNKVFPHCTRELKTVPIKNYLKKNGILNYEMAIGIRIDEPDRIKKKPSIIYPLVSEFSSTKLMVNRWWFNQSFNLNLKDYEGNCDMCWKKSKRKLMTLIVENPDMIKWWVDMETTYGYFVPIGQKNKRVTPIVFFRQNESGEELIEDSKFDFKLQDDAFSIEEMMFYQVELDFEGECGKSSCEPF